MKKRIKKLEPPDSIHLKAAEGWLELGNHVEAFDELEMIAPELRVHPDVLEIRWQIYSREKKWDVCIDIATAVTKLDPSRSCGWIYLSCALHELKRTQEAWNNLVGVEQKFPDDYLIRYNLACYAAQLGRLREARDLLKKAIDLAGRKEIRMMALNDLDLEPLWKEIGKI